MFRSLRSRLLALLTGIVVLTVGTIGLASGELLRRSADDAARDDLRAQVKELGGANTKDFNEDVRQLERLTTSKVFVLVDKPGDDDKMPGTVRDQVPVLAKSEVLGNVPSDSTPEWKYKGKTYAGVRGQWSGGPGKADIAVGRLETDILALWRPLALQISAILAGALLAAWLLALVLSYRITRPLHALVGAAQHIANGRYPDAALEGIPMDDEVGQLASAFRDMANKLREVDSTDRRFLMSISHELRTPLTAITGHAQALEDGLAEEPEARDRSLAVIQREASRLDRLVEDIIDLARLRTSRFNTVVEGVNLGELGGHLMAIFQDQGAYPDIAVRGDFESIDFHSDGQRILQILRNLINNALRYATTEVRVEGERVRGRIRISVTNDGEPIPEDMHEKIFEPFVGTKREGGMGLGLAIGRELSWALGGNLRIVPSSTGAIFELTLPLEPPGSGR